MLQLRTLQAVLLVTPIILLTACVGPKQLGYSNEQWQSLSSEQQKDLKAQYEHLQSNPYRPETIYQGPTINVTALRGEAMMPPFTEPELFLANQGRFEPGQCRSITLRAVDTTEQVLLTGCYDGLTLSLDPSAYDEAKRKGTVFFTFNPIWRRGITYNHVNSQGFARLRDANINIKAIPEKHA